MRCGYSSDGSTVNTYLSFDLYSIDQKLKNTFNIHFLLARIIIRREYALLWFSIAPAVPYKNIGITSQEEVQPISIGWCDHPLVYQSIRIRHYYCWLSQILLVQHVIRTLEIQCVWVYHNLVTVSGWKEHAINHRLIPTRDRRYEELSSFEVLFHD